MALPAGFARATLRFTGPAVPTGAAMVWCFEDANPEPDLPSEAGHWADAWTQVAANIDAGCILSSVLIKHGPDSTGPSADVGVNVVGAGSGNAETPSACGLIHKITNLGGRAGRGRAYFPGLDESQVQEGGNLASASLAAFTGTWADFKDVLDTAGLTIMLEHANGATPTLVTDLSVDGKTATQRRRLRR